tara:strand:+ start:2086 stop:2289 length:204 start_codon:yes stop_codon:yes gene_type:complete
LNLDAKKACVKWLNSLEFGRDGAFALVIRHFPHGDNMIAYVSVGNIELLQGIDAILLAYENNIGRYR